MVKNVLVITYSQSGQLDSIVDNILSAFGDDVRIHRHSLKPVPAFPFPWKDIHFWDAMPESVEMIPSKLEPLDIDTQTDYDLIILGYPIWYLSPPIPLTTFLKSAEAKAVLDGKPVVTVIGSRNMWVGAQEDIKKMLAEAGGKLVGNISLRDRHNNLPSVVTIIYWMTTGKKDRLWGIFPNPGISDKDITEAKRFGEPILASLVSGNFDKLQDKLLELKSIEIVPSVLSIERKGKKIFSIWSKFILKKGGPGDVARHGRLTMFKWYLMFVIFIVSPVVTLFFYLTYPLFYFKIKNNINYYKSVELRKPKN